MLEGLFSQLSAKSLLPAMAVPQVPSGKNHREPLQVTDYKAVPLVPPVPPKKTESNVEIVKAVLSASDHQKLLDYMAAIDEQDPEMIEELLTECAKDADKLVWALGRADKVLRIDQAIDDRHYCRDRIYLISGQCRKQDFRPVDDIPRRCTDFEASGVVVLNPVEDPKPDLLMVTCRGCHHFESYYNHGSGAGACNAGVMPYGACWSAETRHECEKYQALELEK